MTANLVRAFPARRVPCRRFLRAYERLTGTAIGSPLSMLASTPRTDSPIPTCAWAQTQAAVFAFARQAASPEERLAFDLDEPVGVIYATQAGCLIAQVCNDNGAREVRVSAAENFADPFSRFQLAHAAGLGTDQRLGRIIYTPGTERYEDPVVATLDQISIQAAAFNQHQDRLVIDPSQATLEQLLTLASEQEAADALALAAAMPAGETVRKISGRTTYLLIWADRQHRGRPGQDLAATWGFIEHDRHTSQQVRVAVQSPADRENQHGSGGHTHLQQAFGLEPEEVGAIAWSLSDADLAIAGILGFTTADIWLQPLRQPRR